MSYYNWNVSRERDTTTDKENLAESEAVDAVLLREATMWVIGGRRNAEYSNLEQVKETKGHKNDLKEKEFVVNKRTTTADSPGKSETFVCWNKICLTLPP